MNTPSISFIVPYYNIEEALLNRCLQSVVSLGDTIDWELLLIDDGSSFSAGKECVERLDDPRIRYVRQENKGLGEARNAGMQLARHTYLHFLDADDYLFRDATIHLLGLLASEHPDILMFRHKKVNTVTLQNPTFRDLLRYDGPSLTFMQRYNIRGSACCYFFRRELVRDLRFTPGIYHEDEEFTPLLLLRARRLMVTDIEAYAYYQRPSSIIQDKRKDPVQRKMNDMVTIMERLQLHADSLSEPVAKVLHRRVDMLTVAVLYLLVTDVAHHEIVKQTLRNLRDKGFFPLHPHLHSMLYVMFLLTMPCEAAVVLYHYIYRLFRVARTSD